MEAASRERVPPEIGEGEEWDQARTAMRNGYAAFLKGEEPSSNPHTKQPWENFSGYKRKKEKSWTGGYLLAAVREGPYKDPDEAAEDLGVVKRSIPRNPRKALYAQVGWDGRVRPLDDRGEHLYRPPSGDFFERRHDAIGNAVTEMRYFALSVAPALLATKRVATWERVRRPQLPPLFYATRTGGRSSGVLHRERDCEAIADKPDKEVISGVRSAFDADQGLCGRCG